MNYQLIMPDGKIMQFYVKDVAELYKTLNGGMIETKKIENK